MCAATMNVMDIIVVLLPLVFVLHEFEEIIMFPTWTKRHEAMLAARFPMLRGKIKFLQSPAFVLVVVEEFIIVSGCTIATLWTMNYIYWYFALLGYSLHLLPHIAQAIVLRRYVPAIITSVLCLPYCVWAVSVVWATYSVAEHLAIAALSALFCVGNLLAMHKVCAWLWTKIKNNYL